MHVNFALCIHIAHCVPEFVSLSFMYAACETQVLHRRNAQNGSDALVYVGACVSTRGPVDALRECACMLVHIFEFREAICARWEKYWPTPVTKYFDRLADNFGVRMLDFPAEARKTGISRSPWKIMKIHENNVFSLFSRLPGQGSEVWHPLPEVMCEHIIG